MWFHRNRPSGSETSFDTKGGVINTEQGKPIPVGRTSPKAYDFDTMQGPRTSLVAADFDGDGAVDLVVNSGTRAGAIPANSLPRGGRPNCRWFP